MKKSGAPSSSNLKASRNLIGCGHRRTRKFGPVSLIFILLFTQISAFAFETDQFNLPPKPLADIGEEVSAHVERQLLRIVGQINVEIIYLERCLAKTTSKVERKKCHSPAEDRTRIEYLRSNDAVARKVYQALGAGLPPFTRVDWWMGTHRFTSKPARYRPPPWKSIFSFWPTSGLTLSPTINMYGAQFGTDKIAHLFQQGYDYYQIIGRAVAEGKTPEEAERAAIAWGQKSERTFYGTKVSGVYSNADLCANFVGLRFYQGLTREISLGEFTRPPVLSLSNGFWVMKEGQEGREALLKPFISDHLSEAYNPSLYTTALGLRALVRRTMKKRICTQWLKLEPPVSQTGLDRMSKSLELWQGEDYGFTASEDFVTIANTCFAAEGPVIAAPTDFDRMGNLPGQKLINSGSAK